jgi:hypothetical protein
MGVYEPRQDDSSSRIDLEGVRRNQALDVRSFPHRLNATAGNEQGAIVDHD